ncbi:MAG: hypothetical protein ACE5IJ_02880 [Thermoplasmata archaeon]
MRAERDMTKEMAYYSAGYLIIGKRDREEWMDDRILPTKVVSASSCICEGYPYVWDLFGTWRTRRGGVSTFTVTRWPLGRKSPGGSEYWTQDEIIKHAKDKLNLDRKSFSKLGKWVKKEYEAKHIEFPHIFLGLNTAREFYRKFLQHIPDLELIGIGFPKESIDKYRKDLKRDQMRQDADSRLLSEIPDAVAFDEERREPYMQDEADFKVKEDGLLGILSRFEPIDPSGIILGFEILGGGGCYNFHSHICYSLDTELREELGVIFNENGLIDSYEDAARSTRYIEEGEEVENVDWYPCPIVRYEFL